MAYIAKRKFNRKVRREAVKLLTPSGIEYATFEDLGAGGLKLWMERAIQPGTLLELQFTLRREQDGSPIQELDVKGRVVRSSRTFRGDGYEIGVEFRDLDSAAQRVIHEALIDSGTGPF